MSLSERNQQNAQHSTGPKTEEGKARSSQNARRHGLASGQIHVPDGLMPEFQSMYRSLFQEIRPVGELQMAFFEQLIFAQWQLSVARATLAVAQIKGDDKLIHTSHRYIGQYERSFARSLKEIKTLQTDLALRAIPENEALAEIPLTCQVQVIAAQATRASASTERTQRAAHRATILEHIGAAFCPSLASAASATPQEAAAPAETHPVAPAPGEQSLAA